MIDAGQLDLRCSFEARIEAPDSMGGFDVTWSERFIRWGALAFAKLNAQLETIHQGALTSQTRGTLTVREDPETRAITPDWRVRVTEDGYRTETWNIREIHRPARGWLRMVVETGVPS